MKSYGYADVEKKIPATKDLVFPIASITKQFTGLMLEQLVEQGKVRLSDPVEKYLPEVKKLHNPLSTSPITLIQLATHTSGLDREPDDEQMLYIKGSVCEWENKLIATIPLTRFYMNRVPVIHTQILGMPFLVQLSAERQVNLM
jgi:CubicO group peptidase (beta-lactamase class C family)